MASRKQGYSLRDIIIKYNDKIVGGAQTMEASMKQSNTVYGEAGTNKPTFILRGEMRYEGSIEKVEFNFAFAKDILNFDNGDSPEFTLTGINKKTGETVNVIGAVFKEWNWSTNLTDATKTSYPFDALDIKLK